MNTDLLGYFITWTCYGTWLPGDDRGWTKWQRGDQVPQPLLTDWCREKMVESPIVLCDSQREIVNNVVREHCKFRGWHLHDVSCRTTHCHVVVTASDFNGEQVRDQFKAWATRRLKERQLMEGIAEGQLRQHWWTAKGSVRLLFDEESLAAAIAYVRDAQDIGGSKVNS